MKNSEFIAKLDKELQETTRNKEEAIRLKSLYDKAIRYEGDDEVISFEEVVSNIKKQKDELKIFTGWSSFDAILKGFRLQQVVVVSALTKSGKTSWLMDLTSRIPEHNPVWFPFEESAEELMRKYLERGEKPPKGFVPKQMRGSTLEWIEKRVIESIAKYDSRVVCIDQLDFIVPLGGDNHSLRVGQAMRDLKAIAKKWNVCIFLICHLVKTKMDMQPTLEDLKGSSSIGQEADTVILLWREMSKKDGQVVITNNLNVSVQANRRTGTTGNVKMIYEGGKFSEHDWAAGVSEEDNDFIRKVT